MNVTDEDRERAQYLDPTPEDLESPDFNAVWNAIKRWDLSRDPANELYAGATGNDVMRILAVVRPLLATARRAGVVEGLRMGADFAGAFTMGASITRSLRALADEMEGK